MSVDLGSLFRLDVSGVELVIRASLIYLSLLVVLRVIGRRETGSFELPELLMIVLIADGVQNGMAGSYNSVSGALLVAATLLFWNTLLDALAYRSALVRRLVRPAPLLIVRDGRMIRRNMRRELITPDELQSKLREQGVQDLADVREARVEPDGEISLVRRGGGEGGRRRRRSAGAG